MAITSPIKSKPGSTITWTKQIQVCPNHLFLGSNPPIASVFYLLGEAKMVVFIRQKTEWSHKKATFFDQSM